MYSVHPPVTLLLAQVVEGSGPVVFLIGLLLGLTIFVGAAAVVRRINRPESDRALPPGKDASSPTESTDRPVVDPLADRAETEAPVEITEGMSLKDIKKAKRAKLTQEFKAGEGAASVRAQRRAGARTGEHAPQEELPSADDESSHAVATQEPASQVPPAVDETPEEDPQKTMMFSPVSRIAPAPSPAEDPVSSSDEEARTSEAQPASEEDDDWSLGGEDDAPAPPAAAPAAPSLPAPPPGRFSPRSRPMPAQAPAADAPAMEEEATAPEEPASPVREEVPAVAAGADAPAEVGAEASPAALEDGSAAEKPSAAAPAGTETQVEAEAAGPDASLEAPAPEDESAAPADEGRSVREGLDRTRGGFIARLGTIFSRGRKLTEDQIEEIEEVLFTADVGVKTSQHLLEMVQSRVDDGVESSEIWRVLREETSEILSRNARPLDLGEHKPAVLLIVGVNGVGKTTTIGKMAAQWTRSGKRVLMVAADTFRAAAVEQLREWSERVGCGFSCGKDEADPSGVVFDGVRKGVDEGYDIILCDTAGRLHTKTPLIDELRKIRRSIDKACPGAPHEVILVLDANTGQNAIAQARQFREAVDLTGLVLTKLDGTAKGGVIIGISAELALPVYFIGIGEAVEDLRAFDADEFVDALFS